MFVKLLIGANAGEVRQFPFVIARDLIKNGRGERFEPGTTEVPRETPTAEIDQPQRQAEEFVEAATSNPSTPAQAVAKLFKKKKKGR